MAATYTQSHGHSGNASSTAATLEGVAQTSLLVIVLSTVGAGGHADIPKGFTQVSVQLWDTPKEDLRQQVFVKSNARSGDYAVHLSWPKPCRFATTIAEFAGVAAIANPQDIETAAKGMSSTPSATGGSSTIAGELWIGAVSARHNDPILTATNWTQMSNPRSGGGNDVTKISQATYYQIRSSTGSLTLSTTIQTVPAATPRNWLVKLVAYSASTAPTTQQFSATIRATFSAHGTLSVTGGVSGGSNTPLTFRTALATSQGVLWMGGGAGNLKQKLHYSSDGSSWTAYPYNSDHRGDVVALAGSNSHLWVWEHTANHQRLLRIPATGTKFAVYSSVPTARYPLGMIVKGKGLYRWTGADLFRYDASLADSALPITTAAHGKNVYPTGLDADNVFGGIVATDNSVVFYSALEGQTTVYEYRERLTTDNIVTGSGEPIYNPPLGFTAKAMCYQQGNILLLGEYSGKLALMGLTADRAPTFFGYIRPDTLTLTARSLAPGQGNTVLIGCYDATTTYVFVYDLGKDAFSLLDSFTTSGNGTPEDLATYKLKRVAALGSSSTVKAASWADDTTSDTSATGSLTFGAWDMDLPEQDKILVGFIVTHSGTGGATFSVDYQIEENGAWVVGASQSATTAGPTFVAITTSGATVKFRIIRIRINFTNCQIYTLTARAAVPGYYETFDLVLRMKKEGPLNRPSTRSWSAEKARNTILTAATAKNAVAFVDGYRSIAPADASSYTVTIENVQDVIKRNTEGALSLKLRSVAAT